ncbi:MAG TPA: hypothetical protein VK997_03080 [Deferrisomatales bacterium]|nr:hypothetical protein [Deferrisomatales bacterium]
MKDWRNLKGKRVVVVAGGVEYRGTLLELGESSLLLRAASGHREIRWERVTRMREDPGTVTQRGRSILG